MKEYSSWEYLLIDVANNHHTKLDKTTFETRIEWAKANLDRLEDEAKDRIWKTRPLYLKACMAIRDTQKGEPIGHLVGMDAVNSGMQIMSVVTGCISGARATGLIDTNERANAYEQCRNVMSQLLGSAVEVDEALVKKSVMTSLYGSEKEPEKAFGKGTAELAAFEEALFIVAPGAVELLSVLLASWQSNALSHTWVMPDGWTVDNKVTVKTNHQIEVDELDHHTFDYTYYRSEALPRAKKNAANVTHSIDAYVLRAMIARTNFDEAEIQELDHWIMSVLMDRSFGKAVVPITDERMIKYQKHYMRSGMPDMSICNALTEANVHQLTTKHLKELRRILTAMRHYGAFEMITIHDDYKAHPNNMNAVRFHYKEILAELADSRIIEDIINQIYGVDNLTISKLTPDLSQHIRNSNDHLS